ncbi:MAG: hypothetical protein IKW79_07825, partial [Schwartzia sp.]|nr:hypothetical protein [Schwartzia sp. (in: firmicutes)]
YIRENGGAQSCFLAQNDGENGQEANKNALTNRQARFFYHQGNAHNHKSRLRIYGYKGAIAPAAMLSQSTCLSSGQALPACSVKSKQFFI